MADYDLIIIGGGPAGMTAAIYGARANLSVLMLDELAPGGKMINTSEIRVSVLIDEEDAVAAVRAVHDKFFGDDSFS